MNKATTQAVETAKAATNKVSIRLGPDLERDICKLAGKNISLKDLKKEIDEAMALRAQELSRILFDEFRMTLGL